jgi:hypothetical protein
VIKSKKMSDTLNPASFRDPDGFIFYRDGQIYRQVNLTYREDYDHLMTSGLYRQLVDNGILIPHQEVDIPFAEGEKESGCKVLQPEEIPFLSYPYEWCFSQLKDAALTTLRLQELAFQKGMCLKDGSAYNIQFLKGKPVFIDTLSFTKYREGEPWAAYRQFCQHFLAPLALMSCKDLRLGQLLRVYIDGIPLDLAASLLPFSARFQMSLLMHLYWHGKSQKRYEGKGLQTQTQKKISRLGFQGIIDSLKTAVKNLQWKPTGTVWEDYYRDTNYSAQAFQHKQDIVAKLVQTVSPGTVWDLGANNGFFSRIAVDRGISTVAFDFDPAAVEKNWLHVKEKKEKQMLPLLLDLTNPSPGLGWENMERSAFVERGPVDLMFSLALLHHLAIANNVPLGKIAALFSRLCYYLVIEFVPKADSQVQRLLASRVDVFARYTQEEFEKEFSRYFKILESVKINDSLRTIYLLKKN